MAVIILITGCCSWMTKSQLRVNQFTSPRSQTLYQTLKTRKKNVEKPSCNKFSQFFGFQEPPSIVIRLNLLEVCPSVPPFEFVVSFIPFLYCFKGLFLRSIQFGGSSYCPNLINFVTRLRWQRWHRPKHSHSPLDEASKYFFHLFSVSFAVVDPAPAPLIFRPKWGPKGRKKFFWRPPPPLSPYLRAWMAGPLPYLRVWIRHCFLYCKHPELVCLSYNTYSCELQMCS